MDGVGAVEPQGEPSGPPVATPLATEDVAAPPAPVPAPVPVEQNPSSTPDMNPAREFPVQSPGGIASDAGATSTSMGPPENGGHDPARLLSPESRCSSAVSLAASDVSAGTDLASSVFDSTVVSPVAGMDVDDGAAAESAGIKPGDCVWAKFGAKPNKYWPAIVLPRDGLVARWVQVVGRPLPELADVAPEFPPSHHLCQFFGSYDWTWTPEQKIERFETNYERYKKSSKSKVFENALIEAARYKEEGVRPDAFNITSADDLMRLTTAGPQKRPRTGRGTEAERKRWKPESESERISARQDKILRNLGLKPPLPLKEWSSSAPNT